MKRIKPQIFIPRKFESLLLAWKANEKRLPLIVKGARQVGKTECIRHFAEGRYASFVEINFALYPEFKAIVRDGYSAENVTRNISLIEPNFKFIEANTLIFFDEIQDFPEIATSFKSFAQQGKFDVISSGSLLGIHLKRIESISVGYQETAVMRSIDFEEFLEARGYKTSQLDELYETLKEAKPFGEAANATFDRLFLDYLTLGGMPEVVESYFVKGTFEGVPAIQRRIVSDYRSDVRKYAEGLDPLRIVNVFNSIPAQLAKENKKFQLSHIEKGARYKDYWGCVEWLEDAGIVNVCKSMDFPELPIAAHLDATRYKLYMADSGLLVSMLDEESQEDLRLRRDIGTWKGGFFENAVAEALVKSGAAPVYYKKENSTLEMDFFVRSGGNIVPIEVKAGNAKSKSLRTLIDSEHYKDIKWGIKLVKGNVGFENGIFTIPHWCAFFLRRLVKDRAMEVAG
jgi:hypothetical protein